MDFKNLKKKIRKPKVLRLLLNVFDFQTENHTVKKLWCLTFLFSCVFHIGRKPVHDGAEKIITLYLVQVYVELETFGYTFNDAEN